MKETRKVNSRWTYIPFTKKVSRELRLPESDIDGGTIRCSYEGGGWYEYIYETDIPWEYR
jgi:hypothetical protein